MKTARYLLAKYIPDLRRGEPRNVGVIVWSPEGVEGRFVGEKAGRPGEVDGRSVPSFVTSPQAYKQWVEYWRAQLESEIVVPASGGAPVRRDQVEFLAAFGASNKGNFALVDGGFLLDRMTGEDLPALADHLFATLVDNAGSEEARDRSLDEVIDRLLQATRVRGDDNFKGRFEVSCPLENGADERFEFDYAYQNGSLRRLYQRVPLPKRHKTQQLRIDATAWRFERVNASGLLQGDKPVAMSYPTEEQQSDPDTRRMLDVLRVVGRVLDLHDEREAEFEFRSLSSLGEH